jgi:hypothetical protein
MVAEGADMGVVAAGGVMGAPGAGAGLARGEVSGAGEDIRSRGIGFRDNIKYSCGF